MTKKVSRKTVQTVRERERERKSSKIGFINNAKNNINKYIKRIDCKQKVFVDKLRTCPDNLSFLCAQKEVRIKDKYA